MPREQIGSTPPSPRGVLGMLMDLFAALRPSRSPSRESSELLDDHEEALSRAFPEGKPSGDGSAQWDRHLKRREADLEWQLMVRKWFQVAGLIATFASVAAGTALTWNYLLA
jgi:hypothetical protein